jgi:predicted nucleic acid-binding protein
VITYLLDVNVLIALLDPAHVQHEPAHAWFGRVGHSAWATCPLTENGVLRIIGNPKYPNTMVSPASVAPLVVQLRSHAGHTFWSDDVSLLDEKHVDATCFTVLRSTDRHLPPRARSRTQRQVGDLRSPLVVDAVPNGGSILN